MGSFTRTKPLFAAVAATVLILSGIAPAAAIEPTAATTDILAKASLAKHRRMMSIRGVRHVAAGSPLQRNLDCSGEWCGRQFVLIVGIGF